MNRIFKKHFVYYDESIGDLTLETFAIKSLKKRGKIIFIDKVKSSEDCLRSFSMINKRSFGRTTFRECDSFEDVLKTESESEILFLRYYNKEREEGSDKKLMESLCHKDIKESVFLLNIGDCFISREEFKTLTECLYRKGCQLGMRTDDISFVTSIKTVKDVIFYKSAKNINFL